MSKVFNMPGAMIGAPAENPDNVLEAAKDKLTDCLVIGWEPSGQLYVSGSTGELGDLLTLMELAKATLISGFVE